MSCSLSKSGSSLAQLPRPPKTARTVSRIGHARSGHGRRVSPDESSGEPDGRAASARWCCGDSDQAASDRSLAAASNCPVAASALAGDASAPPTPSVEP